MFVFTSDHKGEEFWDHGRFEHGHSLMGVLTRIPLILSGYGISQRGKQDVLVEHVDLFRGLLEVSGAGIPAESREESLLTLLQQETVERWSVSENTLYGDPMISLVSPKHRIVVNQRAKRLEFGVLMSRGWICILFRMRFKQSSPNRCLVVYREFGEISIR